MYVRLYVCVSSGMDRADVGRLVVSVVGELIAQLMNRYKVGRICKIQQKIY